MARMDAIVVPRLARGLARISRAVRRWRVRPLTVVATVLVLAVVATGVWRLVRPEPGDGWQGSSSVWVGVHDGDSVPRYIDGTRAELAALTARDPQAQLYALVSFGRYLTPAEVQSVAASVPALVTLRGIARVPLPHRQTALIHPAAGRIPEDILADMTIAASRKDGDAQTYRRLAETEADPQLREIYRSNADVSQAEADGYRAGCPCVFALVVRGSAATLTALARHADVRAVDPAPEVVETTGTVWSAPLPEQADRVEPPADDALVPTPTATG
jgi:hypothetical protein